jgi:hypothetical protein
MLDLAFGGLGEGLQQQFAPGVGEADEAHRLGAALDHVGHHAVDHQVGGGLAAEDVAALVAGHIQGRDGDHRGLLGVGHVGHGHGGADQVGAEDGVHLVFGDQLAHVLDGIGGVGAVVEDDEVDLLAAHGGGKEGHGLLGFGAQGGGRAGEGGDDAHVDVGQGRGGHEGGDAQGDQVAGFHGLSPLLDICSQMTLAAYAVTPVRAAKPAIHSGIAR